MSYDTKKYPGYTEMLFKHRKSTLTRKKALATFLTSDEKEIQLYDFYNKYYFFMKFDGFIASTIYGIREQVFALKTANLYILSAKCLDIRAKEQQNATLTFLKNQSRKQQSFWQT